MILFRSISIVCVLYFYLIDARIMSNLAVITAAPLYAHSLRRRLAYASKAGYFYLF
jgi:hypothetical protein